ncbi:MAG: c-type cytochrome [Bacteroidetes bacterium]|nr:c-type cytochrome [Bacteroidota bacterium]
MASCTKDPEIPLSGTYTPELPPGFPELKIPESNPITYEKIQLGKALFFEKGLSRDSSLSCASCHRQENAFSDPGPVSTGIGGLTGIRNASPLFNLAWKADFFRDGGVQSLELTPLNSLHAKNEFDSNTAEMLERLKRSTEYKRLFKIAFNDTITINGALQAMASFMRSMISGNSAFDEYLTGKTDALTESQIRGMNLFFSDKTSCSECHGGFNFRKEGFFNNGFFEQYPDSGRQRITLLESDRAKFSVPSLRNISLTAPYMHNGSVNELSDIIEIYNQGGFANPNKSEFIRPLGLSEEEKADLVSFLNSLSDYAFINNEAFRP